MNAKDKRKIKLRYYRNLKGYKTQEIMAQKLGISNTTYSLKENGSREFTEKEINKLLHLLEVKYEDIFL